MLVAEHESLVTQVEKLADPQYWSDDNKEDRLLNLSYGEPPRTSSGLSFHGGASPIPIPIPAPASSIPDPSSGLPSSLEGSSDKENSTPGTQQSIVTELVAIVEEEHLDIGGESGHMMARQVQDELVCSVLGQRCKSKAHPSHRDRWLHPFPRLGDGGNGFPFSQQGHGEQNIGGGDHERFRRTRRLRQGADGDGDIETDYSTDGSRSRSPVSSQRSSSPVTDPELGRDSRESSCEL